MLGNGMGWKLFAGSLLAFTLTAALLWFLVPVAHHVGLVDHPGGRKTHYHLTPLIGGIAMFVAFAFSILMVDISLSGYRMLFAGSLLLNDIRNLRSCPDESFPPQGAGYRSNGSLFSRRKRRGIRPIEIKMDPGVALRYAAFDAGPGAVLGCLALVVGKDPSYVRTSLMCWVTARSALSLCFKIGQRA